MELVLYSSQPKGRLLVLFVVVAMLLFTILMLISIVMYEDLVPSSVSSCKWIPSWKLHYSNCNWKKVPVENEKKLMC